MHTPLPSWVIRDRAGQAAGPATSAMLRRRRSVIEMRSVAKGHKRKDCTATNIAEPPFRWPSKVMYYFTKLPVGKCRSPSFRSSADTIGKCQLEPLIFVCREHALRVRASACAASTIREEDYEST
jgi:hypothetical protein